MTALPLRDYGIPLLFVTAWPPRLVHAIARLLGVTAALGMFCGHCPPGTWGEE